MRFNLIEADRAAMLPLPPVSPELGWSERVRLGRDYYVRVAGNDYSVHPSAIGQMVQVRSDLGAVEARLDGRVVAAHQRAWARALTVTDPAHVQAAAVLRAVFGQPRATPDDQDMGRDLAEYDRAFGVTIDAGRVGDGQVA